MIPKPFKQMNDRIDVVSNEVITMTKVGTVAFVLISIVAVTALIVTVGIYANARK